MTRILFITANRIGDAILSTGVLRHLVETYENPKVTIVCGPVAAPLFRAVPGLERVITLRKGEGLSHWLDLRRRLARERFDLGVDLRGSLTLLTLNVRRRRIWRKRPGFRPKAEEMAGVLGLSPAPALKVWTDAAAEAAADQLMPAGQVLALGPGANWLPKRWAPERFAALAERLTGPDGPLTGAAVLLAAGPDERAQADAVAAAVPGRTVIDAVGLGLVETAACLARCALFVGNDSGLMHLSAAMAAPTLGLFGPTDERRYAPFGPRTAIVRGPRSYADLEPEDRAGHTTSLMDDLSVEAAYSAALRLLS
jgi:heptosyltransferase III